MRGEQQGDITGNTPQLDGGRGSVGLPIGMKGCQYPGECDVNMNSTMRQKESLNNTELDDAADAGLSLLACVQILDNDWRMQQLFDVR